MTDLERVTRMGKEHGDCTFNHDGNVYEFIFTPEELLAFEQDVLAKQSAEIESLKAKLAMQAEALQNAQQAIAEIKHAVTSPHWFTNGEEGARKHLFNWMYKANEITANALNATQSDVDNWMAEVRAKAVKYYIQQQRDRLVPKQVGATELRGVR